MMKKTRGIAAIAVILAVLLAVCCMALPGRQKSRPIEQGNLLENTDFSVIENGMPAHWMTGMWVTSAGASYLEPAVMEDGTTAVLIDNVAANDARFEQVVDVRENATYRLSARVMAENCDPDQIGANVSFLGVFGTSEDVHDTDGKWETVELYAQTGKGQRDVTVCVRVGGYGSEAKGRAWFTDVRLEQVEQAPIGMQVLSLATPQPQKEEKPAAENSKAAVIPGLLAVSAAYLAAAAFAAHFMMRPGTSMHARHIVIAAILGLGLLIRLLLAPAVAGYGVDMGCFGAWAGKMAAGGPAQFYEPGYFCDYPPGYLLVLGVLGRIAGLLGISFGTMSGQVLLKLVPVCCDLALAAVIYAAASRASGRRTALGIAALIALSPAFIITSACWGQIDSVLALLLVLLLPAAAEGKWHAAIPLFALAVLSKPQAGLLAPLGIAALVRDVKDNRGARKPALLGLGLGVLATVLIALPFSPNQPSPFWLVDKYVETLSSYAYATLSTGNLMFLLGGNWVPNAQHVFLGITYGQLGMILMVLSFLAGIAVYLRGKGRTRLFLASAATMQLVFVLGSKMHERYILPALALLLLAYLETGDLRLLISGVLAGAASAVNIGTVLAFEHLVAPNLWLGYVIGVLQLVAAVLTVWACVSLSLGREPMRLKARTPESEPGDDEEEFSQEESVQERRMRKELLQPADYRLHMTRWDWALMIVLTAVYAVIGFYQLGTAKAPQGGYTSTAAGESVVIDLGQRREGFRVYYYGGVSDTAFSVAVSDDGVNYSEETDAKFTIGDCYKWMAVRNPVYNDQGDVVDVGPAMLSFDGRYIRLTFEGAASALWEVAAVDRNGEVIPTAGAESFGGIEGRMGDANSLIDEQDTVPQVPGYLNSMYFDEIYHARTGYEHAHGQHTYETTHPPLGKVFMSWCIELMGMTPFAWRFAGALCGVLMIPAFYLLAKQLLASTLWAALCALLLSADCMHFTQTRIATIDSFPVLFMMLMFLFMARWMKMSFYHQRLRDTFVPLALSGVCMGLAIASKWIGCYGAVGLAVLFFARFLKLWRQSVYAAKHRHEHPAFARAADLFMDRGIKTIAACFVFFVFIPVLIYVLSYIPYLRAYGEIKWNWRTFERIWDAQVLMFDYHKNLVAEHYFSSPWYEWPLIIKPMWYYQADFKRAGMASSILAFGNPAVWWTGLVGMVFVLVYSLYRNAMPALRMIEGREDDNDRVMPVICVGFLSAYLPWVLVSRLTFIYHYFASVPWIILATALSLKYFARHRRKTAYVLAAVLAIAAIALFIAFYPLASGMEVPRAWCDAVSWFDNWMWY